MANRVVTFFIDRSNDYCLEPTTIPDSSLNVILNKRMCQQIATDIENKLLSLDDYPDSFVLQDVLLRSQDLQQAIIELFRSMAYTNPIDAID